MFPFVRTILSTPLATAGDNPRPGIAMASARPVAKRRAPKTKLGRPTIEEAPRRLEALLEVAAQVFVRDGYSGTTIATIAREAGVSNKTIYARFANKTELLQEIGTRLLAPTVAMVESVVATPAVSPPEVLRAFAWQVAELWLSPMELGLYRMVLTESARFPVLCQTFLAALSPCADQLTAYLQAAVAAGRLETSAPEELSHQFLYFALGHQKERALLGEHPTRADYGADIERAVDIIGRLFKR